MPISREDPSPLHLQIAADLRERIRAGEFEGTKFPSLRDLMRDYKTSQATAHDAVRLLQQEQLIISVSGKGTFVRSTDEPSAVSEPASGDLAEQVESLRAELMEVKRRLSRLEGGEGEAF